MKVLSYVPNGYEDIVKYYGDPDINKDGEPDLQWQIDNLKTFTFTVPMRISWNGHYFISRFKAHKLIGNVIVEALDYIFNTVGVREMRDRTWDYWGGCYNFRPNANAVNHLSIHSWAAAIDLNPHLAPNGVQECGQPKIIIDAFEKRGFLWVKNDWMHCQAAKGY